ncbi:MAG TPA: 23S rRNA (guanosine(2251)-2'-O)-methyltransferase RlmB [Gammaproteobacteria bacterium]|nr:23S rRNA (guanosine(2251)-2'-O)-methyltransferase RlmB [Gammaproteobacteria bacterium]
MPIQLDCINSPHVLETLLDVSPHRIRYIECAVDYRFSQSLDMRLSQVGIHCKRVKAVKGWRAWCEPLEPLTEDWLMAAVRADKCRKIMVLDGITDPHNLGACLRSCAAFSIDAVMLAKHHSVKVTETVRNVACGGAERVPVVYAQNLARCLRSLKDEGYWVYGASESGDVELSQVDFHSKSVLILGSEGKGMKKGIGQSCDVLFSIETQRDFSCLNVSVAAGVCVYVWGRCS